MTSAFPLFSLQHEKLKEVSFYEKVLLQVRSVGNTLTLHETALIEAFNLKAAIEFLLKNTEASKEALTDLSLIHI